MPLLLLYAKILPDILRLLNAEKIYGMRHLALGFVVGDFGNIRRPKAAATAFLFAKKRSFFLLWQKNVSTILKETLQYFLFCCKIVTFSTKVGGKIRLAD